MTNLYLIDGNSYFYRAYHALKGLTNSKGFPTNAIYIFTNMLFKILREKKPERIAIAFDTPAPTERHILYEDYKATRPQMPDDLAVQIPYIKDIIKALKIPTFEVPGYEADDIISTIAKKAEAEGLQVFIVSGDKDMMQIVGENIFLYDPMKDLLIDKSEVLKKFGVPPEDIPNIMALAGDSIDNIPGVKGIGEKLAKKILKEAGSIEALIENPDLIKNERIKRLIVDNLEVIKLSKELSTINYEVPLDFRIEDLTVKEPDWKELFKLFVELQFNSLLDLIPSKGHLTRGSYHLISDKEMLLNFIGKPLMTQQTLFDLEIENIKREKLSHIYHKLSEIAFDVESSGRDPLSDYVVGISLCKQKGTAYYVPIRHLNSKNVNEALLILKDIFEDRSISKIGHNLKFDILMLKQEGIEVAGILYDTMVASYLLNPNKQIHSLEEVAAEYLQHKKKSFKELLGKCKSFEEVPLQEAIDYAAEDAELTFELKEILFERLKEEGLEKLYFELEMPLIKVLAEMQRNGIMVDLKLIETLSKEIERELDSLQRKIYSLAGEQFNINSTQQLRKILFDKLKLKTGKKTKTGYSTSIDVLEELAKSHELPAEILNYRTLYKFKTTYLDILPKLVNKETGRIHTTFNQTVTATGRLSSSEPNLQNIPVKGFWGNRIREIFIAPEGSQLLSADYSQIELRILAHMSKDETLLDAFSKGIDIHSRTAAEIFNIPLESVSTEHRRIAKTINFGIIYGISPFGLSEALSITTQEANRLIEGYFKRHSAVKEYIDRTLQEAREKGFVTTLLGRKRQIPAINSDNAILRQQAERMAINTPIQGTAADLIKKAMISIHDSLKSKSYKTKMILQIHDELLFEVPETELESLKIIVKEKMESALKLDVPLMVDLRIGKNWAEIK
ncbi:MAG: DNA polymerase I [Thermodesulfovibrionales bacterium]|nr:DNA polymerase I [Thermodesulfovibrionales bacterium]